MKSVVVNRPPRYSTAEVALILGTEPWRIKNFALPAYGLEPTVKAGGRGGRRYYGFDALLKLAVANELYDAFLSPDGIKGAVAAVENVKAIQKWIASYDGGLGTTTQAVLTLDARVVIAKKDDGTEVKRLERVWKVLGAEQATDVTGGFLERGSVAISLNLTALWESVVRRITDLEAAREI